MAAIVGAIVAGVTAIAAGPAIIGAIFGIGAAGPIAGTAESFGW